MAAAKPTVSVLFARCSKRIFGERVKKLLQTAVGGVDTPRPRMGANLRIQCVAPWRGKISRVSAQGRTKGDIMARTWLKDLDDEWGALVTYPTYISKDGKGSFNYQIIVLHKNTIKEPKEFNFPCEIDDDVLLKKIAECVIKSKMSNNLYIQQEAYMKVLEESEEYIINQVNKIFEENLSDFTFE